VSTTERLYDRGTRLGERRLTDLGAEFRAKRLELGLSQKRVATAVRISASTYSRIERGKSPSLSVVMACRIGAVLGLDVSAKAFAGGDHLRDEAQVKKIRELRAEIGSPLRTSTEVLLPQRGDRRELRRWDLIARADAKRTALEFEMRIYDAQAQQGAWNLKRRDDPVDHFVLVLADTKRNRETLRLYPDLFSDLPRLRTATVLDALRAGKHPPTGLILY